MADLIGYAAEMLRIEKDIADIGGARVAFDADRSAPRDPVSVPAVPKSVA